VHLPCILRTVVRTTSMLVLLITLLVLQISHSESAAAATYEVSIPGTTAWPGWWTPTEGGPFTSSQRRIITGAGSFASGSYGRWRLESPGTLRIAGGRISGVLRTTTPGMVSRLRAGSDGGAVRTLWSSDGTSTFNRALPGGNDWVEFGLYATTALRVRTAGDNSITMTSMTMTMRDDAAPITMLVRSPDPLAWHGPTSCASWTIEASDAGSGITQMRLERDATEQPVRVVWTHDPRPGLAPGQPRVARTGCITVQQAAHGANTYRVTAMDAAGNTQAEGIRARFDLRPPVITGEVGTPAEHDTSMPRLRFSIVDTDSGIERVRAHINGVPARVNTSASATEIMPEDPVSVGIHAVEVDATDHAGNRTSFETTLTVVDHTPPVITMTSPLASGSAAPWAAATATDSGSGIATSSWNITVDGAPTGIASATSAIAGPLGILAPGTHTVTFQVADHAGNTGNAFLTYTVNPVPGTAPSGIPGGRSGIFVQDNLKPAYQYGSRVRVRVLATRSGRPLAGHRLDIHHAGTLLATSMTDVTGMGAIDVPAFRPGTIRVSIPDPTISSASLRIHVAPQIRLRTTSRRPRTGHPIRMTGRVHPAPTSGRARARLYTRVDGSWFPLRRTIAIRHDGTFTTNVTSAVSGVIAVQARIPSRGAWSPSASNVVLLHVHNPAVTTQSRR
jgi:hypothetical protein